MIPSGAAGKPKGRTLRFSSAARSKPTVKRLEKRVNGVKVLVKPMMRRSMFDASFCPNTLRIVSGVALPK